MRSVFVQPARVSLFDWFRYRRWMTAYLALYGGLVPVLGLLSFSRWPGAGWLLAAAFLLLGIWQASNLRHRQLAVYSEVGWTVTLLLATEVLILLTSFYIFVRTDLVPFGLVGCSAFLLPFIMANAWQAWRSIPKRQYRIWLMPVQKTFYMPRGKAIAIKMKLRLGYFDVEEHFFDLDVSARVKLGLLFTHFMAGKNEKGITSIEMEDEQHRPYGWQFYHRKYGLFASLLDPQWTLEENKIGNHDVIIARRIRHVSDSHL